MNVKFSQRNGFNQPTAEQITVRRDASSDFRAFIVELAYDCGFTPKTLRAAVCRLLKKRPDSNNWSEYPNINDEVHGLIDDCAWYRVYDVVEGLLAKMSDAAFSYDVEQFESEINDFFIENGVGWKVSSGIVEARGTAALEQSIQSAVAKLRGGKLESAHREMTEAIRDLSRRPEPDLTGAVHHAMAALECVAREASGDQNATLGEVVKRHSGLIPRPLDEAVTKAWGYASENARHMREGQTLGYEEVELVVGIACSVCSYLAAKHEV